MFILQNFLNYANINKEFAHRFKTFSINNKVFLLNRSTTNVLIDKFNIVPSPIKTCYGSEHYNHFCDN